MLDRLLGRAALKERIEALEEEKASLSARLESAEDQRQEAVRARQEAEERVNRLEDRIAELEDRVERAESGRQEVSVRGESTYRAGQVEGVLSRLESVHTGPEGAISAMVGESVPDAIRDVLGDRANLVSRAAPALVLVDDADIVAVALRPPVPPEPFLAFGDSFRIDRDWFQPRGRYSLALVRSDLFAMGTYEGRERIDFEGFRSDVKGDHSKGGFSQARFERRRDEQIDAHLQKAREALSGAVDPLYLVGESSVLSAIDADATVSRPVDATGAPRSALSDAVDRFWRTTVYRL
ncbi:MAG: Vms1/Ankzf1 family peptidyl-tRNA hydrolase [Halodesulfurarchaeum sp.]